MAVGSPGHEGKGGGRVEWKGKERERQKWRNGGADGGRKRKGRMTWEREG